jgi:hypothetical protein
MDPIQQTFEREFPKYEPFPFGAKRHIDQLVRHILLTEPLIDEFAAIVQRSIGVEIDDLMDSFRFERCVQRTELAKVLRESSSSSLLRADGSESL